VFRSKNQKHHESSKSCKRNWTSQVQLVSDLKRWLIWNAKSSLA